MRGTIEKGWGEKTRMWYIKGERREVIKSKTSGETRSGDIKKRKVKEQRKWGDGGETTKSPSLKHTHMHSCHFASAAFKAVMTGQRVIRDSEWRGHYSCSPLPANNCNYPNSTLTTIDLSLLSSPRPERVCVCVCLCLSLSLPLSLSDRVTAECVPLSTRVVHTCCQ